MPFVQITKPVQGDATKLALINQIIDNLAFLNADAQGVRALNIPNGSFEEDADGDSVPDRWVWTAYTAGLGALDIVTSGTHGAKAFKITAPGGGGNGGGYLETEDYAEWQSDRILAISFRTYSTVVNMANLVEVRWYTAALGFISSSTLWSDSTTNPLAWGMRGGFAFPPSTARFFKLRLTGGSTGSVAGDCRYDDVRIGEGFAQAYSYKVAGTYSFTAPTGVSSVRVSCWGGGGQGDSGGGRAGGGGGFAQSAVAVTPGTAYAVVVAAGGSSAASQAASSTFAATTVIATGGHGGTSGTALGGSGTGNIVLSGGQGSTASHGGGSPFGGGGGNDAAVPSAPGGGGGGGAGSGSSAGAAGQVTIEFISQ